MHGAWTTKGTKIVYRNPWIRVEENEIVRSNGSCGVYGVLRTKGGVGAVVVDDSRNLILVAQYRYPTDSHSLEIPKGAFDSFDGTETALAAVQRELAEETGVTALDWRQMATVHTLMGYSDDTVHLFFACDIRIGESHPDENEHLTCVKLPIDHLQEAFTNGLAIAGKKFFLSDATSIAGILMASQRGYLD
jgi:8-oxo-dGDP phosphatase